MPERQSRVFAQLSELALSLARARVGAVWAGGESVRVLGVAGPAAECEALRAGLADARWLAQGDGPAFREGLVRELPAGDARQVLEAAGVQLFAAWAQPGRSGVWVGAAEPRPWPADVSGSLARIAALADGILAQDAESRYRELVEASPDAIVVHAAGKVLFANAAAARNIGLASPEQVIGRPITDYLTPESARIVAERVREMTRTSRAVPIVRAQLLRADGSVVTGELASTPVSFDGQHAIQVVIRDVSAAVAAEEALRRREQEFKALVEDAPDVIMRLDARGALTYINPAVERYTGIPRAQVLVEGALRPMGAGEDVRSLWRQALKRVFARAESTSISFSLAGPDGERVFECRITPQQGPDGRVEGALAVGRDITELMRVQEALARSEATLRSIFDGAAIGITQITVEGRYVNVNPAFAAMLGYAREELVGLSFGDITHPDDVDVTREMQGLVVSGERQRIQLRKRFLRKDGSTIWARVTGSRVRVADDGILVVTMVEDVTAQLAAEEALRASEARFRSLIEHSSDLIAILDPDGRVVFQSASVLPILGYEPEHLIGERIFELVHPDEQEALQARFAEVVGTPGMVASAEYRLLDAAGNWRTLHTTAENRLHDPAVGGVVVNTRDLTNARELEAQLLQSQKMEAVGRMAGGIAHDFNNILTAVQGHASLLADELPAGSPHLPDVEQIQRSAQRAASLTRQLLAFSRRQVLQPKVVDLNAVVSETEKMLLRLIGEDVELHTEMDPALARIKADPAQVQQILLNLAVNSRDAMPAGGRMDVRTSNVVLDEEFVRQFPYPVAPGPYVLLAVSDTGSGIDPAIVDHIFEPFFTTKAPGHGTGLGLSSVYGTVKQSGGYIWVDTAVGVGTTFRIYLPAVDEVPERSAPESQATPGGSEVVLLVEDEAAVRALARRVLERGGYTVLEACDGQEALEICERRTGTIDLVLTDVVMPRLGGAELAARVRDIRPQARVLFMSGYSAEAAMRHGVVEGAGFLGKPFSPELLRAAVANALRERRAPA